MPDDSGDASTSRQENWLLRAADKLAKPPWLTVVVVLDVVVIGIATLVRTEVVATVVIPIAVAVIGLAQQKRAQEGNSVGPSILLAAHIGVLVVAIGTLVVSWYGQARAVDVSGQVELTNATSMSDGDTAIVTIPVVEPRPGFTIAFQLKDNDPEEGVCAPSSELAVTPEIGAPRNSSRHVSDDQIDQSLHFPLSEGASEIALQVVLSAEAGCELNLSVSDAQLVN